MEFFPLLKGHHYQLTERSKSQYRPLEYSPHYMLSEFKSCPTPQKPITKPKKIKYSINIFNFPFSSKSTKKKIIYSQSDNKLLKHRLLRHRNSEQVFNAGISFNHAQSEKKLFGVHELNYELQVSETPNVRKKKELHGGVKVKTKGDKKFRTGRNVLVYYDHTVPQSISIQSKSFKGV